MAEKFNILSISGKGKGLKIFSSSAYKEHEQTPLARVFWELRWIIVIWIICAIAFCASFIIEHIWRYGWSPASAKWTSVYLKHMLATGGLSVVAEIPVWFMRTVMRTDMMCMVPLFPIIAYFFMADGTLVSEFNPNSKDKFDEKSSREANEADIKEMGLLNGFMMVLGYFKKKPLMMNKTLSTLCVAPPGAGKTQGVVLPTIFDCTTVSMIINDPKPELKQKSSAYRSTIGPVFIMNWAGQDDPERGIYYPSWNPLSPEHVPYNQEQRDLYIDSMCNTLIPDKASTADPHWTLSGRAALSGIVQFIVSKVERARADDYFYSRLVSGEFNAEDAAVLSDYYLSMMSDPNAYAANALLQRGELNAQNYVHVGTWANIPDAWRGKEASLPMILDWLNASQLAIAADMEEKRRQGDQLALMGADPMHDVLQGAVDEARLYAYAHRAILELTQLANTPDKERGSIISTMMTGLAIFRNAAVRNRTSHSDFHFTDMRGLKDPRDGKVKPVTVYLSINMVDAEALNPITGIFIELMSSFLLANPPRTVRDGVELGPCPVLFVMDEMPKMQKLQAVIQGPDLGRGQQISYLIIGQDIHQIAEKYGQDAAATIISTTAAKIVFRQNDPDSAARFSRMMGEKIKMKTVKGPDGKDVEEPTREPLFSEMDIMKLPNDKQLVIFQGWYHRPIKADTQMAFADPRLSKYMDMGECSPLPEFLIPAHHAALGYPGVPKMYDPMTHETKILG